MDFDLTSAQKLLQRSARDFLGRACPPERVRALMATETGMEESLWYEMAEQGWVGLLLPEAVGGLGLSLVDLIPVAEEMGRACLPGPFLATLWAAALIERAGTEGQQAQYLIPISEGALRATISLPEEELGGEGGGDALRLEGKGDGYRLSGRRRFVLDGGSADLILCVVDGIQKGATEPTRLLLPVSRKSPGLTITALPMLDATRKMATVDFDGVEVAGVDALVAAPDPWRALEEATDIATVALCADLLGGMEWTLATTVEYARTRQQFGRAIGTYQAVQHQCADMFLMVESARSALYHSAWAVSVQEPQAHLAVSVAKAYCADAAREVGNRGIQVHGGIGFTWEHGLHLYYKRAKSGELLLGDATRHRESIATWLFKGE
jgi:alkylation response protein AidB-like acyl-CoA dehydrogenase